MASLESTTARLRRTFRYPSDEGGDSDGSDAMSVMDEDEQEKYINSLTLQNQRRNSQFRRLLLAMPILSTLPYLTGLFRADTFLVSFLALSSLAASGYLLLYLPPTKTGIALLDQGRLGGLFSFSAWGSQGSGGATGRRGSSTERRAGNIAFEPPSPSPSPILNHLPYLNLVLSLVVAVAGFLNHRLVGGHHQHQGTILALAGLGNLPLIINVVVLVSKVVMAGVDPERELSGLRYGYKGA